MKASSWRLVNYDDNNMYHVELPNSNILKIGERYYLASDPHVESHGANTRLVPKDGLMSRRQIAFLVSDDGYKWRSVGWIERDNDAAANHVPCLYYENDILYVFYAAQIPGDYRYDKIRILEIKKEVFEKW